MGDRYRLHFNPMALARAFRDARKTSGDPGSFLEIEIGKDMRWHFRHDDDLRAEIYLFLETQDQNPTQNKVQEVLEALRAILRSRG